MAAMYRFIRAMQLDGNYPGSSQTGAWPLSAYRIDHGWGIPPFDSWPSDPYSGRPAEEPSGIDLLAFRSSLKSIYYRRLFGIDEILSAVRSGAAVNIAIRFTDDW